MGLVHFGGIPLLKSLASCCARHREGKRVKSHVRATFVHRKDYLVMSSGQAKQVQKRERAVQGHHQVGPRELLCQLHRQKYAMLNRFEKVL